jgi:hypothetical protein
MTIQIRDWIYEFVVFGIKEARACVFAGSFFVLLKLSQRYLARPCAPVRRRAAGRAGGRGRLVAELLGLGLAV